jgi:YVTN family beta-propeller protein
MRSGLVYISHITLDYVSVLDPETNRLVGRIKSGMGACCVDLLSAADRGYIANYKSNDVTVFDKKTGKTIATVSAGEHPSHLSLTGDSKYLLIGHESNDGLWFLNTRTNQITKKIPEGTGILRRHDNGKKIYQSQIFIPYVFVIDPETQTIAKRINVGGRPLDLAFTPDQRHLYIANYDLNELEKIDTETDSVVARIPHLSNARGIAITRDARFAFVTNVVSSTVTVVDLASSEIVKVIPVGSMPTAVAFRTDGKYAYVSCQGSASVFVIDTQTQEIVRSIVVDSNPIQVQVK